MELVDANLLRSLSVPPGERTEKDISLIFRYLRCIEDLSKKREVSLRDICKYVRYEEHQPEAQVYQFGQLCTSWYILLSGSIMIDGNLHLPISCFGFRLNGGLYRHNDCFTLEFSQLLAIDYTPLGIQSSCLHASLALGGGNNQSRSPKQLAGPITDYQHPSSAVPLRKKHSYGRPNYMHSYQEPNHFFPQHHQNASTNEKLANNNNNFCQNLDEITNDGTLKANVSNLDPLDNRMSPTTPTSTLRHTSPNPASIPQPNSFIDPASPITPSNQPFIPIATESRMSRVALDTSKRISHASSDTSSAYSGSEGLSSTATDPQTSSSSISPPQTSSQGHVAKGVAKDANSTGTGGGAVDSSVIDSDEEPDLDTSSYETQSLRDIFQDCLLKDPDCRSAEDIQIIMEGVQNLPAFSRLALSTRRSLCGAFIGKTIREAEKVILENDQLMDSWNVVLNGVLELRTPDGTIRELMRGDIFGVSPQNEGQSSSSNGDSDSSSSPPQRHVGVLRTLSEDCQLGTVSGDLFLSLISCEANYKRSVEEEGKTILVYEEVETELKKIRLINKGTPEKLILHLVDTSPDFDPLFAEDLLLTFRAFMDSPRPLTERLLAWNEDPDASIRARVARCVLLWVNNHFGDFEAYPYMRRFLAQLDARFEEAKSNQRTSGGVKTLLKLACTSKARPRKVLLHFSPPPPPPPGETVKKKPLNRLAFTLVGSSFGIFISEVIPGSLAEEAGVQRADQLISIEDDPCTRMTLEVARERLQRANATHGVNITVKYNPFHFEESTKQNMQESLGRSDHTLKAEELSKSVGGGRKMSMDVPMSPELRSPSSAFFTMWPKRQKKRMSLSGISDEERSPSALSHNTTPNSVSQQLSQLTRTSYYNRQAPGHTPPTYPCPPTPRPIPIPVPPSPAPVGTKKDALMPPPGRKEEGKGKFKSRSPSPSPSSSPAMRRGRTQQRNSPSPKSSRSRSAHNSPPRSQLSLVFTPSSPACQSIRSPVSQSHCESERGQPIRLWYNSEGSGSEGLVVGVTSWKGGSSNRYLLIGRSWTASDLVAAGVKEFGMTEDANQYCLYLVTVADPGPIIKTRRLAPTATDLLDLLSLNSRLYLKHNQENFASDEITAEISKDSKVSFLNLSAFDLAFRITQDDLEAYKMIQSTEYLDQILGLEVGDGNQGFGTGKANINAASEIVNRWSAWAPTELCTEFNIKNRVKILKKFIEIGKLFRELRNINALFCLVNSLDLYTRTQLKQTWEKLPNNYEKIYNHLCNVVDTSRNFSYYRSLIERDHHQAPVIPYLPLVLKDLTFIHLGNPTRTPQGLVDFEKLRLLARELRNIMRLTGGDYDLRSLVQSNRHLLSLAPSSFVDSPNFISPDTSKSSISSGYTTLRKASKMRANPAKRLWEDWWTALRVRTYLSQIEIVKDPSKFSGMAAQVEQPPTQPVILHQTSTLARSGLAGSSASLASSNCSAASDPTANQSGSTTSGTTEHQSETPSLAGQLPVVLGTRTMRRCSDVRALAPHATNNLYASFNSETSHYSTALSLTSPMPIPKVELPGRWAKSSASKDTTSSPSPSNSSSSINSSNKPVQTNAEPPQLPPGGHYARPSLPNVFSTLPPPPPPPAGQSLPPTPPPSCLPPPPPKRQETLPQPGQTTHHNSPTNPNYGQQPSHYSSPHQSQGQPVVYMSPTNQNQGYSNHISSPHPGHYNTPTNHTQGQQIYYNSPANQNQLPPNSQGLPANQIASGHYQLPNQNPVNPNHHPMPTNQRYDCPDCSSNTPCHSPGHTASSPGVHPSPGHPDSIPVAKPPQPPPYHVALALKDMQKKQTRQAHPPRQQSVGPTTRPPPPPYYNVIGSATPVSQPMPPQGYVPAQVPLPQRSPSLTETPSDLPRRPRCPAPPPRTVTMPDMDVNQEAYHPQVHQITENRSRERKYSVPNACQRY